MWELELGWDWAFFGFYGRGREGGRLIFPERNEMDGYGGIHGMGWDAGACDESFSFRLEDIRGKIFNSRRTTAEPVIVHLARIAFDIVMLRRSLDDFEILARDHDVGGIGPAGPFLAVGAVAEGGDHGFDGILVLDGGAQAGTFRHGERTRDW